MKRNPKTFWFGSRFSRPDWVWLVSIGWLILAGSFLLITGASLMKVMAPPSGSNIDKLIHAGAYAVLTTGLVLAWPKRSLLVIFFIAVGFGILIEYLQHTLAIGRTGSWADALANAIGALAVIGIWIWICPRLKHYLA